MVTAVVFDTEVNSLEAKECVELSYAVGDTDAGFSDIECFRFRPANKFEPGAVAVHGILPSDVEECPPSETARIPESEYVIGHNVDFDCDVLKIDGPKRICTLALSRHLWPEFGSHSLSAMVFELYGMTYQIREIVRGSHNADTDVRMTIMLLEMILEKTGMPQIPRLYELSEIARVPTVWTFGKHKGTKISETPRDYIQWMMRQPDVDKYLMKALQAAL